MLKAQAVRTFARMFLPAHMQDGGSEQDAKLWARHWQKKDRAAFWQDWDFYTDGLCKAGEITQQQYNIWVTPKF